MIYDINNWYWIVGDSEIEVFSSAVRDYVPIANIDYVAWLEAGGIPTKISADDLPEVVNKPIEDELTEIDISSTRTLRSLLLAQDKSAPATDYMENLKEHEDAAVILQGKLIKTEGV